MSEQAYFTPEEYALEAIMKGALRHWPSDVEPDGTNATVVITLAQAKLIRTMLRDSLRARHWDAWNREAREILGPALQGRSSNQ